MKKQDHLIPFEKSKRVICLDNRGRSAKSPIWTRILYGVGILAILYCLAIGICGFGTWFFLVWGAMGAGSILLGWLLSRRELLERIPRWVRQTTAGVLAFGILLFVVVEGMILSEFAATAEPGAEYVIVLGAQWKENGPSDVLRRRLDKALVYLRENPDAKVIVSGGQGENEPLSEADGMREYLLGAGIPEERILTETESFNTKQNLEYSSRFLNSQEDRVVLVTNNFHMFRALRIARKQGYQRAEGLAASSVYGFLPNNMLREFLSLVKNLAVGNL